MNTIILISSVLFLVCIAFFVFGVLSLVLPTIKKLSFKLTIFTLILAGIFALIPYKVYKGVIYSINA